MTPEPKPASPTAEQRVDQYLRGCEEIAPQVTQVLTREEAIRIADEHAEAAVAEMQRERDEARAEVVRLQKTLDAETAYSAKLANDLYDATH